MKEKMKHQDLEIKLVDFLNKHFDLQERVGAFSEKRMHTLEVELINRCNLSCFYCYTDQGKSPNNLSFNKAVEIINEAKEYGIKRFVWLGGEPTLNPDWEKIIRYSKDKGLRNELWSNGTTLLENTNAIAETCDRFILHLDSIDSGVFTSVQDRDISTETHSKILQGLGHLLNRGYSPARIRLNLVLSRKTLPYLGDTLRYFYPDKVGSITLIPLFATGKGREAKSDIFLSPKELQKAFKLRALIENRPERLLTGTAEYDKWYQMTTAYVSANGDVTPYAGLSVCAGNIYKENLRKILESSFNFLSFSQAVSKDGTRNNINGTCGSCKNSRYCFGTRANSHFHSSKFVESDNTCWK